MDAGPRRRLLVIAVASLAVVVAGVGLFVMQDDGADAPAARGDDRGEDEGAAASSTTGRSTTTVDVPVDGIEDFFRVWAQAVSAGDTEFLVERLHPAVIDLYGRQQCEAYFTSVVAQPVEVEVRSVGQPADVRLGLDGDNRIVDGVIVVRLHRSDVDDEVQARVAVIDRAVRWFSDCGDPASEDEPEDEPEENGAGSGGE